MQSYLTCSSVAVSNFVEVQKNQYPWLCHLYKHASSKQFVQNGVEYTWILYIQGKNYSQFRFTISPVIYWSVLLSSRRGEDRVKKGIGESVISTHYKVHFIMVHENLVQNPSNDKSILYNISFFHEAIPVSRNWRIIHLVKSQTDLFNQ